MPPAAAPWYRRFLDHLPPLPDWFLPLALLVACGAAGFTLGIVVCAEKAAQQTQGVHQELTSILRLETTVQQLERRLQRLEER
jgi:hypothetical protein